MENRYYRREVIHIFRKIMHARLGPIIRIREYNFRLYLFDIWQYLECTFYISNSEPRVLQFAQMNSNCLDKIFKPVWIAFVHFCCLRNSAFDTPFFVHIQTGKKMNADRFRKFHRIPTFYGQGEHDTTLCPRRAKPSVIVITNRSTPPGLKAVAVTSIAMCAISTSRAETTVRYGAVNHRISIVH